MKNVVNIHNAVNERVWSEITHWESALHSHCSCPRLKSFQGKPQSYSPKARFLNFLVSVFCCVLIGWIQLGLQTAV